MFSPSLTVRTAAPSISGESSLSRSVKSSIPPVSVPTPFVLSAAAAGTPEQAAQRQAVMTSARVMMLFLFFMAQAVLSESILHA